MNNLKSWGVSRKWERVPTKKFFLHQTRPFHFVTSRSYGNHPTDIPFQISPEMYTQWSCSTKVQIRSVSLSSHFKHLQLVFKSGHSFSSVAYFTAQKVKKLLMQNFLFWAVLLPKHYPKTEVKVLCFHKMWLVLLVNI